MPFKASLSYSTDPDESAIVWRLQTLAASNGIQMFVPQPVGVKAPSGRAMFLWSLTKREPLSTARIVYFAIITSQTGPAVEKELNYALARKQVIIRLWKKGYTNPHF